MNEPVSFLPLGGAQRTASVAVPDAAKGANASSSGPADAFATAMRAQDEASKTGTAAAKPGTSGPPIVQTARHESRTAPPLEKFEAFVLRNFVESMLPQQNSSFFGTGMAGNIWRSMLAEQLGDELARGGGIGIADLMASRGVAGSTPDEVAMADRALRAQTSADLSAGQGLGFGEAGD